MISVTPSKNPMRTPVLITLFAALLVLTGCGKQPAPQTPSEGIASGFEFAVNPQTEQVTLVETTEKAKVQPQATPSDSRILVPNVDLALRNLSFKFESPTKLFVYFQLRNITADLDFAQPLFFTLSSESDNLVRAGAPLVTDTQLGGDGVLSPGETTQGFRLEANFKEKEPFTFFVDTSAVVPNETRAVCKDPVTIPDRFLEYAVRGRLDKPSGYLSCADLASLTELRSEDDRLTSLGGLEYAVNLTSLNANKGKITDLTPLQNLTNLTELDLSANTISNLAPLQNLTNLTKLSLRVNKITDITALRNLTNLTELDLSANSVSDIGALVRNSGLGSGDRVLLNKNPLSPQALSDIETLRARGVEVESDASGGSGNTCTNPVNIPDVNLKSDLRYDLNKPSGTFTCADLESLTALRPVLVSNLEGLQYAVNLTFLNVSFGGVSDLTPLQNLSKLKRLFLYGNNLSNLSPLQNLTGLEELNLDTNRISDLTPLQNLTNLKRLSLSKNPLYNLAPLQNLTDLTYLRLEDTGVSDISALVRNSGLGSGDRVLLKSNILSPQAVDDVETLIARGVQVEFNTPTGCTNPVNIPDESLEVGIREGLSKPSGDITCAGMESILYFRRGFSSVANLEGLQYAVRMKELRLGTNNISDLSPLQNLTNLTNLDLRNNSISDISALVDNSGLDSGDSVRLEDNPLSPQALNDIETLEARGVDVTF